MATGYWELQRQLRELESPEYTRRILAALAADGVVDLEARRELQLSRARQVRVGLKGNTLTFFLRRHS